MNEKGLEILGLFIIHEGKYDSWFLFAGHLDRFWVFIKYYLECHFVIKTIKRNESI